MIRYRQSISVACLCFSLAACGGSSSNDLPGTQAPGSGDNPPESGPNGEPTVGTDGFVTFESASVRPMALSDDASRLFVTNTPNSTLDIFTLAGEEPILEISVPVGLEPVSVALVGNEAWVVNHLSDSISIVDVSAVLPHVSKTLLVGDEPRDIVFAGTESRSSLWE